MLLKVDENLHEEIGAVLRQNAHDAVSVYDQNMRGHADEDLAAVCKREGRVIVIQDLPGRSE
jgi:predicted nuclease of predicted toxin-antitoxin system